MKHDLKDSSNNFVALLNRVKKIYQEGASPLSQDDIKRLAQELDTYQLELEIQNEELRKTQEELEQSRMKYANLYDFAPVGYLTIDNKRRIVEANLTAAGMLGVSKETLINKPLADFIMDADQEVPYLCCKKLSTPVERQSCSMRFKKKDGSVFHVQMDCVSRPELDGHSGQFLAVISDITEELAIQEQLLLLRATVTQSDAGVVVIDLNKKILFVNPAFARMHGYEVHEILGKDVSVFHTPDQLKDIETKIAQHLKDGGIFEGEIWHARKDGSVFPGWMTNSILHGNNGRPIGLIGTLRDITAEKETHEKLIASENRYRELFNHLKSGIAVFQAVDNGKDFVFADFNRGGEIIDRRSRTELLGKRITEVYPGVGEFGFLMILRRVWTSGKPEKFPATFYKDEKVSGWRENYVYRLPTGEVVAVYDDVTDRKQAELIIRETAMKYQAVIQTAADAVITVDQEGKIVGWNPAAEKMFGFNEKQILGTPVKRLISEKYRDHHQQLFTSTLAKGGIKEGGRQFKGWGLKANGDEFPADISVNQWHINGMTFCTGVVRDTTEREKMLTEVLAASQQLQEKVDEREALFGSVKDAIVTVDRQMRVVAANRAAAAILGIDPDGDAGQPLEKVLAHCGKACLEVVSTTLKSKASIDEYQVTVRRAGRPEQTLVMNTSPLLDRSGNFAGAVLVARDMSRLASMEKELRERYQFHNLIGKSDQMRRIYDLLEDLVQLDTTVLITGESGTGKGMVAKAIHFGGNRSSKPFVTVNCAALAETLLESELFGHVKGSFTGAVNDRVGRFQMAEGGTLLLDEIGDLPQAIQLKLLRVIEEKTFERVGDSKQLQADVRIIACTNKNLQEKMRQGLFRADLYYRLKVIEILVPPLRERIVDLPLLVEHFCHRFNKKYGKNIRGLDDQAMQLFLQYDWPGNVRELAHALEAAFVTCRTPLISIENLPFEFQRLAASKSRRKADTAADEGQAISQALRKTAGNKAQAARLLGMSRRTIYRKMEKYGLHTK